MITVNFDNQIIENYIQQECNNSVSTFVQEVKEFIELKKIKKEISQAKNELEDYKNGNLKLNSLEDLLNED